jgi:peptidoglycan/LPS O-acetylase OafA/YrhL
MGIAMGYKRSIDHTSARPGSLESLDALRGLALLYIVIYHLALIPQPNLPLPKWASQFVLLGGTGVTLFFIISAFCLCLSMQVREHEPHPIMSFYVRRVFRIVPFFYVWLIISWIRDKYWFGVAHSWQEIALNMFFGFNFIPGKHAGFVWASWILSVQMVFYLLFPFIYRYVNDYRKSLGFFFITLFLSFLYAGGLGYLPISDSDRNTFAHYSFLNVLPVFAFGMFIFFMFERFIQGKLLPRSWGVVLVGGAVFGFSALMAGRLNFLIEGFYWQGVIFGALVLGLAIAPLRVFVNRQTCYFGKISYSLYLNHPPLVVALIPVYRDIYAIEMPTTLQYGACILLTLAVLTVTSYFTYHLIEQPGVRIGSRLIKKFSS